MGRIGDGRMIRLLSLHSPLPPPRDGCSAEEAPGAEPSRKVGSSSYRCVLDYHHITTALADTLPRYTHTHVHG